jgi:hypothetical protein
MLELADPLAERGDFSLTLGDLSLKLGDRGGVLPLAGATPLCDAALA